MAHHHKFVVAWYQGDTVAFRCSCKEERSRKMTKEELHHLKDDGTTLTSIRVPRKFDVHYVWHKFVKAFKKEIDIQWNEYTSKDKNGKDKKVRFRTSNLVYKWSGFELAKRIEKWAKRWPNDIKIVGCDDAYHAGSDLVLIEHKAPVNYMGTTVLYIPQCTSEQPIEFFLYPYHRKELVRALQYIGEKAELAQKSERDFHKAKETEAREKGLFQWKES